MAKQKTIQPLPITAKQAKRRLDMYVEWIDQLRETCPPEAEPAHAERAPTAFLPEVTVPIPGMPGKDITVGEFHPYFNALAYYVFEFTTLAPPAIRNNTRNTIIYAKPIQDAQQAYPAQFKEATRAILPTLQATHEQLMRYRQDCNSRAAQQFARLKICELLGNPDVSGPLDITVALYRHGVTDPFVLETSDLNEHQDIAHLDGVLYPYLPLPAHILLVGQEATLGERTFTSSEVDIEGSVKATLNEYCPPREQEKLALRLKKIHEHQRSTLTEILALDAYDGLNKYIVDKIFSIARQERDNAERELQHRQTEGGTGDAHHD